MNVLSQNAYPAIGEIAGTLAKTLEAQAFNLYQALMFVYQPNFNTFVLHQDRHPLSPAVF